MIDDINEIETNLIEAIFDVTILYFAIHGLNRLDLINSKETSAFQSVIDSIFDKINNIHELLQTLKKINTNQFTEGKNE